MNLVGHTKWLETLDEAYGGLANFPDAPSVRIMRQFLVEKIAEEVTTRKLLEPHPEILAEWINDPGLELAQTYLADLVNWLSSKGLKP